MIVAGAFIGVSNTLVTTAVMSIAPVERPVASATYGFVRFIGGGLAPFAAGKLVERFNPHVPFIIGAAAVALGAAVLTTVHTALTAADAGFVAVPAESDLGRVEAAEPIGVGAGLGSAD